MAVKTELEIGFNDDGTVSLSIKGVKGRKCLGESNDPNNPLPEFAKFLQDELGGIGKTTHTSEFYEEEVQQKREIKVGE